MAKVKRKRVKGKRRVKRKRSVQKAKGVDGVDGTGATQNSSSSQSAADAEAAAELVVLSLGDDVEGKDDYDENSIRRSKGPGGRDDLEYELAIGNEGGDGFEDSQQERRREIEEYLKGTRKDEQDRLEALRYQGYEDFFDPSLDPNVVEGFGRIRAAQHLVRLEDHWANIGDDRLSVIRKAAGWLCGFDQVSNIRKVLGELESLPIRDVYPVEIIAHLLEKDPERLPDIQFREVFLREVEKGEKDDFSLEAGQEETLYFPDHLRVKGFALKEGMRPGYEFYPKRSERDGCHAYSLMVDTPGDWVFQILGVETKKIGRMTRELKGGWFDELAVHVRDASQRRQRRSEASLGLNRLTEIPSLEDQVWESLTQIVRVQSEAMVPRYSWSISLMPEGRYSDGHAPSAITTIELEDVEALDDAWESALETLSAFVKRHQPGATLPTLDNLREAFRKARSGSQQ